MFQQISFPSPTARSRIAMADVRTRLIGQPAITLQVGVQSVSLVVLGIVRNCSVFWHVPCCCSRQQRGEAGARCDSADHATTTRDNENKHRIKYKYHKRNGEGHRSRATGEPSVVATVFRHWVATAGRHCAGVHSSNSRDRHF